MAEEVKHYHINSKHRVVFERSAVKGQDGFKVESNDDDYSKAFEEASLLYSQADAETSKYKSVF